MVGQQAFPLSDWQLDDCWRLLKLRGVRDEQLLERLVTIAVLATQRAHARPEKLSQRAWLLGIACEVSRDDFFSLHQSSSRKVRVLPDSWKPQVQTALAVVTRFFDKMNHRS